MKTNSAFLYVPEEVKTNDSKLPPIGLDPNHSHFILVDNGSNDEFGVEIGLRAALENELSKGHSLKYYDNFNDEKSDDNFELFKTTGISKSIPIVMIVVHGKLYIAL